MSTPLKVVAVAGSTFRPSRTLVLLEALVAELGHRLPIEVRFVELGDLVRSIGGALSRKELPETIEHELRAIENADLLVVGAPVYRGSYPGQFKHLFDLIGLETLIGTPVLLAATGGSDRHALVIEHQLRPLFAFFQSLTLPVGVYATESDFADYRIASDALTARIRLAVDAALPVLHQSAGGLARIA